MDNTFFLIILFVLFELSSVKMLLSLNFFLVYSFLSFWREAIQRKTSTQANSYYQTMNKEYLKKVILYWPLKIPVSFLYFPYLERGQGGSKSLGNVLMVQFPDKPEYLPGKCTLAFLCWNCLWLLFTSWEQTLQKDICGTTSVPVLFFLGLVETHSVCGPLFFF